MEKVLISYNWEFEKETNCCRNTLAENTYGPYTIIFSQIKSSALLPIKLQEKNLSGPSLASAIG
ncbi:unnamed protein product [Dovyalis caffra]|uniref:Uncharacterized protein n=1 Tax=Dovyalis caffra TaxID=77055 RepID=A0AAV1RYF8_9ROSI|nr:unnamed protein product [Dovyalis caffra]